MEMKSSVRILGTFCFSIFYCFNLAAMEDGQKTSKLEYLLISARKEAQTGNYHGLEALLPKLIDNNYKLNDVFDLIKKIIQNQTEIAADIAKQPRIFYIPYNPETTQQSSEYYAAWDKASKSAGRAIQLKDVWFLGWFLCDLVNKKIEINEITDTAKKLIYLPSAQRGTDLSGIASLFKALTDKGYKIDMEATERLASITANKLSELLFTNFVDGVSNYTYLQSKNGLLDIINIFPNSIKDKWFDIIADSVNKRMNKRFVSDSRASNNRKKMALEILSDILDSIDAPSRKITDLATAACVAVFNRPWYIFAPNPSPDVIQISFSIMSTLVDKISPEEFKQSDYLAISNRITSFLIYHFYFVKNNTYCRQMITFFQNTPNEFLYLWNFWDRLLSKGVGLQEAIQFAKKINKAGYVDNSKQLFDVIKKYAPEEKL